MCSDGDTGAEGDGWQDNGGDMAAFITEIGEAVGFHNLRAYSIRDLETAGAKSGGQMETEQSLSVASLSLSIHLLPTPNLFLPTLKALATVLTSQLFVRMHIS
ncbi:unnamed protein product [Protopolystoma xenopodis]|uniref:Uncharacterized protein n=1 Tax=Protopolystoma xenopodis TaxID=117903 RepID=A0A448X014_9PLAT|nr:unnamed protein product [Protopolystoma xenopodis]